MLHQLFARFCDERRFIATSSPSTIQWYRSAWLAAKLPDAPPTIDDLHDAIVRMREAGLSPRSVNTHLRALNAFLHWLYLGGHTKEWLKAPIARGVGLPELHTLSPNQIDFFLAWRPHKISERRAFALAVLMLDSGIRRSEGIALKKGDIWWEDLVLKVWGKGKKFRMIPFSLQARKILYAWCSAHPFELAFPSSKGTKQLKRNATRDISLTMQKAGLEGVRCSPHTLRHTFATRYLANGGDPLRLQRILGHSTLTMTMRYVHLQTEDLTRVHGGLSAVAMAGKL